MSVTITSIPASPIRPVASDVTLVGTMELSTLVDIDVPVTVTTMLTGPAGFTINNDAAQLATGSTSIYTSTTTVRSFGRDESGIYTCLATVSSVSSFLRDSMASISTRVTVGNLHSFKCSSLAHLILNFYQVNNGTVYANNSVHDSDFQAGGNWFGHSP